MKHRQIQANTPTHTHKINKNARPTLISFGMPIANISKARWMTLRRPNSGSLALSCFLQPSFFNKPQFLPQPTPPGPSDCFRLSSCAFSPCHSSLVHSSLHFHPDPAHSACRKGSRWPPLAGSTCHLLLAQLHATHHH